MTDKTATVSLRVDQVLEQAAQAWPARTAIVDEFGELDYQTLWRDVADVRIRLAEAGIGAGQGLGLKARNGRRFVIAALAASGCGAVVMPISANLQQVEFDEMLAVAPLHAVLDEGEGRQLLDSDAIEIAIPGAPAMRLSKTNRSPAEPFVAHAPEAAFVRFTSGTTGSSKGVVLSHADVLARIAAANRGLGLTGEDVMLWVLPMSFHFFVSIILYLNVGGTIVVCRNHLAETILTAAEINGATFLYASPLHCRLLAADDSGRQMPELKLAVSTSTGLTPAVAKAFHARFGLRLTQAYGIIEVGLPLINREHAEERPEAIGRSLPGFTVAIVDDALEPLPAGEIGQLAIKGPGMFSAYLNPPQRREDALHDGWFLTGDLARQEADGLVIILGRLKSTINVAGEKVFPDEVEAALNQHPDVVCSRVFGRPHDLLGEVVAAEVVLQKKAPASGMEELFRHCRQRLSGFKTPQSIKFVMEIKETASGKTVRH